MIFLALAFKSIVSFFEWFEEKIKKAFNIKFGKISEKERMNKRIEDGENLMF